MANVLGQLREPVVGEIKGDLSTTAKEDSMHTISKMQNTSFSLVQNMLRISPKQRKHEYYSDF